LIEEAHPSESGDPNVESVEHREAKNVNDQESLEEYDFVFLCDSNRKFINAQLLCPNSTVKITPCTSKQLKLH
jgi:hypothetical protein